MSGSSGDRKSVLTWTISDVRAWLTDIGMARYIRHFLTLKFMLIEENRTIYAF